ncbi:MarR family winged helix-turn-helix transcriptional regulator [Paenibacillus hunanensis]|uniref:DNA-binding MarR family transcriptional regulator n=1 Tax=Paenibacillus hunanensis TaxID=539262 RepID=A0ABU1IU88_9BACL|nr:MarR family winged helix-turn-helix transcriptional regulator [Paenibacillus hunanensis]MCL9661636.1 MarR family winged helix-turn-helix transcriptional regulator [Paenibacillus hunanensis]MDR6242831.1 DNA-binding MarR family transcriptional regulator [Paenibacillus hunanensis]WPP41813.1 MarR family winged helix-turn-helix transcriptional regulator [Paenibacillus hunanensis]
MEDVKFEGISPMGEELLRAFRLFRKADWRQKPVAGHKPSEIMALICIGNQEDCKSCGIQVSELSRMLRVTSPTVTQLIKGMENDGLVERNMDPSDRRAVRVTLTDKGESIMDQSLSVFKSSFEGLVDYLGEEESRKLAQLLGRVYEYFEERVFEPLEPTHKGDGQHD